MLFSYRATKKVNRIAKTGTVTPRQMQYFARKAHRVAVHHHRKQMVEAGMRAPDGTARTNPDMFERLR